MKVAFTFDYGSDVFSRIKEIKVCDNMTVNWPFPFLPNKDNAIEIQHFFESDYEKNIISNIYWLVKSVYFEDTGESLVPIINLFGKI